MNYWALTKKIIVDEEEGKRRKKEGERYDIVLENLSDKYSLNNNYKIFYTNPALKQNRRNQLE